MDNENAARFGRAGVDAGQPASDGDFPTRAADAIANILHAVAEHADSEPGADPEGWIEDTAARAVDYVLPELRGDE